MRNDNRVILGFLRKYLPITSVKGNVDSDFHPEIQIDHSGCNDECLFKKRLWSGFTG